MTSKDRTTREDDLVAEGLAKRMFVLTIAGVVAYVGVVIVLMAMAID